MICTLRRLATSPSTHYIDRGGHAPLRALSANCTVDHRTEPPPEDRGVPRAWPAPAFSLGASCARRGRPRIAVEMGSSTSPIAGMRRMRPTDGSY